MPSEPIDPIYYPAPFQETITFADGSSVSGSGALNETDDTLWLWPEKEMSVTEAVALFGDAVKTSSLRVDYSAIEHSTFDGYTEIRIVNMNAAGKINLNMAKPKIKP